MKLHLLLDVDGVMIPYPDGPCEQPNFFSPEAVEALRLILDYDPRIDLILSSSMRVYDRARNKFNRMFLSAGLPMERVIGETSWEGSLVHNREREIKRYIERHKHDTIILPVDDEVMEGVVYMKTNSITGLTLKDAEDCIEFFKNKVRQQSTPCNNGCWFGLGMTYIRPDNDSL
jgi:hypothetical protein